MGKGLVTNGLDTTPIVHIGFLSEDVIPRIRSQFPIPPAEVFRFRFALFDLGYLGFHRVLYGGFVAVTVQAGRTIATRLLAMAIPTLNGGEGLGELLF